MATKKITLNELRSLVKQIINENHDWKTHENQQKMINSFFIMPKHMSLQDEMNFIDDAIGKLQEYQNYLGQAMEYHDDKAQKYADENPQRYS